MQTSNAVMIALGVAASQASAHSDYMYVRFGDMDKAHGDTDFVATLDIRVGRGTFRQVIATTPVTAVGTMPHYIESTVSSTDDLFASGFIANKIYRFDMSNTAKSVLTYTIHAIPGWKMSHSFIRTPDEKVIAILHYKTGDKEVSGRLSRLRCQWRSGSESVRVGSKTRRVAHPKLWGGNCTGG